MFHRVSGVKTVLCVTAGSVHSIAVQLPVLVPTSSGIIPRLRVFFRSAQVAATAGGPWYCCRSVAESETPPTGTFTI